MINKKVIAKQKVQEYSKLLEEYNYQIGKIGNNHYVIENTYAQRRLIYFTSFINL